MAATPRADRPAARARTDATIAPAREVSRFDRLTLLAVTAVAALLRLPGIDAARDASMPTRATTCSTLRRVHARRNRAAARPEDLRRRLPPRRLLLLPPRAGGRDLERRSGRGHDLHRPAGDRRGRAHVVARSCDRRPIAGTIAGAPAGVVAGRDRGIDVHLEPEPDRFFAVLALAAAWKAHTGGWQRARRAAGGVVGARARGRWRGDTAPRARCRVPGRDRRARTAGPPA